MKAIVMPLSLFVATKAWTPLGTGCCHGTTGYPANTKLYDSGSWPSAGVCQSSCATAGGWVVTFDAGWCTCWTSFMDHWKCQPLSTAATDCGSNMGGATTWYQPPHFEHEPSNATADNGEVQIDKPQPSLAAQAQLGLELGGTKMPGNGCCAGTTSHPASDKAMDGAGIASTEADCNWKCWHAPYFGNVVTWDPVGKWCTCWTQSAMHPNTCTLVTDAADCGSPMPSASTSYNTLSLSNKEQASLELGGTKMGNGCCAGTVSHPASDKAMDGAGIASTEADCNWKCWHAPYFGNVVTWDPVGKWCTCWTQSAMHPSTCTLVTDAGDCGSPMPSAVTSYNTLSLSSEQQQAHEDQVELKSYPIAGCCNAVAQPANYKLCDGHGTAWAPACDSYFGVKTTLSSCFNACQGYGSHVASFGPNNWCTCWVSTFHSNQCFTGGSCGSDYSKWTSMADGFFMVDSNSTSGVDIMV